MATSVGTSDTSPPWSIAVVDDDATVLRAMSRILESYGHDVASYTSAKALLRALRTRSPEVLLLDLRMPDVDGSALQDTMRQLGYRIPIVFLSGQADVATSVHVIQQGAIDLLEKPCDEQTLLAALERGVRVTRRERERRAVIDQLTARWDALTRREREVCRWVVTGRLNKQIAAALGTVEKTVKVHRARVMLKMGAHSVADLVRLFDLLQEAGRIAPPASPIDDTIITHLEQPPAAPR